VAAPLGSLAQHQLGAEEPRQPVGNGRLEQGQRRRGSDPADRVRSCRQPRRGLRGERHVVETGNGDVVPDPYPAVGQDGDGAERGRVTGGEHRVGTGPAVEVKSPGTNRASHPAPDIRSR
jgi:hypothetical protein